MLGDAAADAAHLRTVALLGALYASAAANMTPTTGDVVRLVLRRRTSERDALQVLEAAGTAAAGLNCIPSLELEPMTLDALMASNVRPLALDAIDVQRRTRATSVHLRHVLATGCSSGGVARCPRRIARHAERDPGRSGEHRSIAPGRTSHRPGGTRSWAKGHPTSMTLRLRRVPASTPIAGRPKIGLITPSTRKRPPSSSSTKMRRRQWSSACRRHGDKVRRA
jgi:hypothetical protein